MQLVFMVRYIWIHMHKRFRERGLDERFFGTSESALAPSTIMSLSSSSSSQSPTSSSSTEPWSVSFKRPDDTYYIPLKCFSFLHAHSTYLSPTELTIARSPESTRE